MGNMVLGTHTFDSNPSDMTMIHDDKYCSVTKTYSGASYFNWGPTIVGKVLELHWLYMTTDEYDDFLTMYLADDIEVFDPQDGEGRTFNVSIIDLQGQYFIHLENDTDNYRKEIIMKLLILSEVSS